MHVRDYQRRAAAAGLNVTWFVAVATVCAVSTYMLGTLLGLGR